MLRGQLVPSLRTCVSGFLPSSWLNGLLQRLRKPGLGPGVLFIVHDREQIVGPLRVLRQKRWELEVSRSVRLVRKALRNTLLCLENASLKRTETFYPLKTKRPTYSRGLPAPGVIRRGGFLVPSSEWMFWAPLSSKFGTPL